VLRLSRRRFMSRSGTAALVGSIPAFFSACAARNAKAIQIQSAEVRLAVGEWSPWYEFGDGLTLETRLGDQYLTVTCRQAFQDSRIDSTTEPYVILFTGVSRQPGAALGGVDFDAQSLMLMMARDEWTLVGLLNIGPLQQVQGFRRGDRFELRGRQKVARYRGHRRVKAFAGLKLKIPGSPSGELAQLDFRRNRTGGANALRIRRYRFALDVELQQFLDEAKRIRTTDSEPGSRERLQVGAMT